MQISAYAATFNTNLVLRHARNGVVLVQSLANCIERAALSGKEKVGARVVGELKVKLVASQARSSKSHCCCAILAFTKRLLNILLLVNVGHHMVTQPGVHNEVASAMLLNYAYDRVRVGHFG